jgi:hypothetical protein
MPISAALGESNMEVLQKAKNRTTICPDDTTSRNTSEVLQDRDNLHTHVYWSIIPNSQLMKLVSISGGMDKEIVVYDQMEDYSATEMNKTNYLHWRSSC